MAGPGPVSLPQPQRPSSWNQDADPGAAVAMERSLAALAGLSREVEAAVEGCLSRAVDTRDDEDVASDVQSLTDLFRRVLLVGVGGSRVFCVQVVGHEGGRWLAFPPVVPCALGSVVPVWCCPLCVFACVLQNVGDHYAPACRPLMYVLACAALEATPSHVSTSCR